MDEETFRQALPHCSGYTELNWRGESLLHPRVVDFVAIAKRERPDLDLGLHTNGVALSHDRFAELCEAGIDWLHFSLHSEESCGRFLEARQWNAELPRPIRLDADVDSTKEAMVALSSGLSPGEFRTDHMANWAGFLTGYRQINPDPVATCQSCPFLVEDICLVSWDGRVNACCWDFQMRHELGPAHDLDRLTHRKVYELCGSCLWLTAWSLGQRVLR
jgi:hypothetical protein